MDTDFVISTTSSSLWEIWVQLVVLEVQVESVHWYINGKEGMVGSDRDGMGRECERNKVHAGILKEAKHEGEKASMSIGI
ncbi:hypothetical protein Y032_0018g3730 [Ancylostoma ceylanicum]|uniref:Uncharacterized protein n=1 Tax=Ancylostoma ceylanicum TaxID=53326 RepID=A0A016V3A0_9BILA|nr:hypothetical protein Y032_0018g3730 [Ancylostoma ceylanicum]